MSIAIRKDLDELHPKVKELALKLLEECKKAKLNIGISEAYRTIERQDYLYAQGRTRPGSIVTYARGSSMSSYHQWGLAFDVYNNVIGDAYNVTILNKVGTIGQKLGLEWGGNWASFKDRSHFQYTFGLSIADLNAGKRPPDYLPPSTDNPQTTDDPFYEASIQKLVDKKIIGSPDFWRNLTSVHIPSTQSLILKTAKYFNPNVSSYESAVTQLIIKGIISSPHVWLDTSRITVNNIKSLIKKSAQLL
ncbi:M15 family metallopeptidase [Cellulosilyticum sp. I15G10I2]|uniref:M15 family metallopeptidase n=1 Tax=Cellulosilyticum sp. I15G10I2 TaxID=1892843 RepID=UPI00085C04DB|nr:M15 family metallopeptidase [Cellulosilyticum sp. I15G10I2]